MRLFSYVFVGVLFLVSGCAGAMIGPSPVPSGDGVLVNEDGNAVTQLGDGAVTIWIGGYEADVVFIGPVVPLIPIPNMNEGGKLQICFVISPKNQPIRFSPRSIKVIEDGKEYQPNSVLQAQNCQIHMRVGGIDPGNGLVVIERPVTFTASFDLKPPRRQFSLVADGLTTVHYSIQRRAAAGLLGQR